MPTPTVGGSFTSAHGPPCCPATGHAQLEPERQGPPDSVVAAAAMRDGIDCVDITAPVREVARGGALLRAGEARSADVPHVPQFSGSYEISVQLEPHAGVRSGTASGLTV
jgi:hypothetical protein